MTSIVRRTRPRLALVGAALVACLLVGCTGPDGAAPVPGSPAPSAGVPSDGPPGDSDLEPAAPAVSVRAVTADGIELLLSVPVGAAPGGAAGAHGAAGAGDAADPAGTDPATSAPVVPVTVTPDEDGSSRVSFGLAVPGAGTGAASDSGAGGATTGTTDGTADDSAATATLDLVSPADGSLLRNGDGSISVLDAAGTPLGGLSAPEATEPSGSTVRAGVVVVAPTRAEVRVKAVGATPSGTVGTTASAPPDDVTVTTWLGAQGVRSATWGNREGGRSLAVDPTPWARQSGLVGEETAWAQLVASEPEADSSTMRDQFDCHALGATDKKTWNLEPWRPDVGFLATAAARCNPTD
ncbi:DUF2599 domain-containing protein [Oerskovia enterophila]|uniref:DUF2599 domain-containing protein n=2 Tax=Oerskovia enterophila TaxID=43678 RepID=A0ABX2Y283_9CELL|nr:DUF2599 domain-containing protein [Oerskovia enterophila]OCI30663.1 hypothetical protein OERS_26430 [Oerskovia enterophila]